MAMSLAQGLTKKARYFVKLVIWLITTAIRASKQTMIMLESRMPGQLACPVWRGLGRNASQQWDDRAPLPPYITKLRGPVKWYHYYLYVIIDVYSRFIVGWLIAEAESAELAEILISTTCHREGIRPEQLGLPSDRGPAMQSKTVAQLLIDLEVAQTFSRPYTPNDNAYSEAQFKTLKYRPGFPERFASLAEARNWVQAFVYWYNYQHYHSALGLLTPAVVHHGQAQQVQTQRQQILATAYEIHPERFVRGQPTVAPLPASVWINPPPPSDPEEV
jgi:putative transposase